MSSLKSRFRINSTLVILFLLGALFCSALVAADGEMRPATEAEKEAYRVAINTFAKAVPKGPAGWDIATQKDIEELKYVAAGDTVAIAAQENPLLVEYYISWRDTVRKQTEEAKLMEALEQQYAGQLAALDESAFEQLWQKMEAFAEECAQAAISGNYDEVQRIQAEMEKITAILEAGFQASDEERNKLMEQMLPHDVDAGIRIYANYLFFALYSEDEIKKEASIAGGTVYRTAGQFSPERGWEEGTTYVFLGKNWLLSREMGFEMVYTVNEKIPLTAIQAITVAVQADPERARDLLNRIDWNALKSLIKN